MADHIAYITAHTAITHQSVYRNGGLLFADVQAASPSEMLVSAYKHFNIAYPKFYKMDNLCKLGFLAAEMLVQGGKVTEHYKHEEVGLVLSNTNASLDADINYFNTIKNIPSPAQFVYTLPNIVIGEISIRHHYKGENAFFVSEKFDAQFMWFYVSDLLRRTALKACICGWVECLGDNYKAVLWLVEKKGDNKSLAFTIEHIHQIYELTNGEING